MNLVVRVAGHQLVNLSEFDTISVVSVNAEAALITALFEGRGAPTAFAFFVGSDPEARAVTCLERIYEAIRDGSRVVDLADVTEPATEEVARACGIEPKKEGTDEEVE